MRMMAWVAVGLLLAGCAPSDGAAPPAPAEGSALLRGVPHVRQRPDFCGEACAEMWLRKLGKPITQDQVFAASGVSPALGRGACARELNTALQAVGFRTGAVWHQVRVARAQAELEAVFQQMLADLRAGVPSIVCMRYEDAPDATEHFRLVLGYDARSDEVVYHEPAEDNAAYQRMKKPLFCKLWPLKYDAQTWTVIRFRLEAGQVAQIPPAAGFGPADYAQHVRALRKKLPAGFAVVIQPPFVVVGDEDASAVAARARGTVKWAVDRLKQDFFTRDPASIITIWLFRDKASYDKHTRELFDDRPNTPYGYYSAAHQALIMNIQTGGGTLVHEIVHPFIAANFPECPAWLNEGLGSLYEQSGERGGRIIGYTNWRLSGLQRAIRERTLPSFEKLTAMSAHEFYNATRGDNYAQARYLCYYLQEKGLLVKFYQDFHANRKADPTGYKTLQKALDEKDMDAFMARWQAYVMRLTFP